MAAIKKAGRIVNVKRNIIYGIIQVIVSQMLPFIVRTILIYRWGVDYLGLNSLFTSILSVLSLMELGFGTAIVYSMYKPVAENDIDLICTYLSFYRKTYRIIGLLILIIGIVLMPFLNIMVKDPTIPGGLNLYICYLFFLSDSVVSYLLYGYLTSIPTAYQRRDVLSRVDMGVSVLQCIVKSLILLTSSNFYLYLLCIPVITVIRNLFTAYVVRRMYPDLKCNGQLSIELKQDLNKKVYGILISKLTAVSRTSMDSLCISAFIGLAATGMYSNYFIVMSAVLGFSTVISNSMKPSVGNSIAIESPDKNYSDMRLFDFIYMAVAGWATVCLLCLFQPFMLIWIGEKLMLGMPVVLGLCAYFYILQMGSMRWAYQEGAGLWWECRYIMIAEAIANIVLNICLCKVWGVAGIVLATVISVFITNYWLCPEVLFRHYFKNGRLCEYWLDHAEYILTMALVAGLSWMACERLFPINLALNGGIIESIICLFGRLIVCTATFAGAFWIIWHRNERYKRAKKWVNFMMKV